MLTRLAELKGASDNVEETAKGIPPKQWGRDAETGSEKRGPALSGHTHTHTHHPNRSWPLRSPERMEMKDAQSQVCSQQPRLERSPVPIGWQADT